MSEQQAQDNLIVCDLSVFTDEKRDSHMKQAYGLFSKVTELRESDKGYALRLPDEENVILTMAQFINDDRRCCQFINFGIEVESFNKGIWLTLKGDTDEAKAAIHGELIGLVPDNIR